MRYNNFYCYKKQNEWCLKLVLLPLTLIVKVLALLAKTAHRRFTACRNTKR